MATPGVERKPPRMRTTGRGQGLQGHRPIAHGDRPAMGAPGLSPDTFEMAAGGMVITDTLGRFVRVNPAFARLLGRDPSELVGTPFYSLTSPDDMSASQNALVDLLAKVVETVHFEKRYLRPDGSRVWVDMNIRSLHGPGDEVIGFLAQASDITKRKAAEASLGLQALLFDAISDAVFIAGTSGNLIDCNRAAERITGYTREQLLAGQGGAGETWGPWAQRMRKAITRGGWAGDLVFGSGEAARVAETTIIALPDDNSQETLGIAICRDVTDARERTAALAKAERRARHDARHDQLTGLPNRQLLLERFEEVFSSPKNGAGASLLMVDLDRFKDVNDTLGHQCGDELLVQVGARLKGAVRDHDTVVRLGGDEFAVLLPGVTNSDVAMALADRIRAALELPFRVQSIDLDVEASVGVTVATPDFVTSLRQADVAMYIAKRQGLGAFPYHPSADDHDPVRLGILGELRHALTRHELVLHFQPKVELSTSRIVGAEALVRWQHPVRGLVPPDEFIPLAEHTGLIRSITRYVLDAALAQEHRWIEAGEAIPVAVNLSARNLIEDGLVERVTELLHYHGVPPSLLELEITESSVITDITRVKRLLGRLRGLGLRVAVDDFGTGFTTLAELKDLPVDVLKVDRSFIKGIADDPNHLLIVQSVLELSRNLGLTAVAEGVEDQSAMATLTDLGCAVVQGYHIARPLAPDDFSRWYRQWGSAHPASLPASRSIASRVATARGAHRVGAAKDEELR